MKPHILKIAVILFVFCFLKSSAQEQKVSVGSQPAEIIRMGDDLHVFCSGADMNGNGIVEKDSGDVEASWWIFDAATMNVKMTRMLDSGFLNEAPLNVAMYKSNFYNGLIIYHNNHIKRFEINTQKLQSSTKPADSLKNVTGLFLQPIAHGMGVDVRMMSRGNGKFYETRLGNSPELSIHNEPIHFLASKSDDFPGLMEPDFAITLDRGTLGMRNSLISRPFAGNGIYTTILGEGANFMKGNTDTIFVVMYGDHSVHLVDKFKGNIVKTIPTQTIGFKGPRECAIDGDNLFVTTYNCDIRRFSISTGELLNVLPISGKADPIQIVNGKLIIGITRTCDSLPNNSISVIDITTSVENEEPFAIAASVSPNPFKNSASISASFPPHIHSATIEIFTSSGNSIGVFRKEVMNGELHFPLESDVLQLAQGQYMVRISAGKQMSVVPFAVVR